MNKEHNKNQLLKDWKWVKLEEVCLDKEGLRRGPFGSAIKKEFFVPNGYKVYEQSNAIYDDANRGKYFLDKKKYQELINFNVQPGDLIVSCSGTLGRIAEIPNNALPGVINQALLRVRLKNDIIEKKYFLYNFRSAQFQRKIFDQSQGTAMSNLVGVKDFKLIQIFLPPKPTQQAIVSKIEELFSELDKGIENLRTAQQQLKIYRQSVLKWAFEGRLSNIDIKQGELPKGWNLVRIEDATISLDNKRKPINKDERKKRKGDIPYYGANGQVGWIDDYIFNEPLVCVVEDETFTGREIPFSYKITGKAWVNNHAHVLKPKDDLNVDFLNYQLFYYPFLRLTTGTTGRKKLTKGALSNAPIKVCSIKEQNEIVQEIESRLSVAEKMEESITLSLQQAEALRQSILKRAFEGKLIITKL